jgi:hypothetical protein
MSLLSRMPGLTGRRPPWLAEDAVLIEPVSAGKFACQPEITRIRAEIPITGSKCGANPAEMPSIYRQNSRDDLDANFD